MLADIAGQLRDLRIEHRPLAALLPYARNPRTHSRAQIAQLARSIREFGWTNPVLVDGANGIIAGHGRVLAARELGLVEVPVIELAHLSEEQKRAYIIADNQTALLAGWDAELLALELGELKSIGFDLELTGFSPQELDTWLGAPAREGLVDDDAAPELPVEPLTRPGDLWRLGEHRLLCGDATVPADLDRLLDGERVAMVFTDPPYNVDYGDSAKDKLRGKSRKILNDDLGAGFGAFLAAACASLLRVSDGGSTSACRPPSCTPCSTPSPAPAGTGARSSSGPRTRSPWAGPITNGSSSRSSMVGPKGRSATGAGRAIRAMSGTARSRCGTTCIRP